MADEGYQHGSMDTSSQEKSFEGFIKAAVYSAIACFVVLIFMALANS